MNDLIEFLLARLYEDEEFARRAASAPWKRTLLGVDGVAGDRDQTPIPVASEVRYWHGDHIARWDPIRVLAEVEAKRQIVDLWRGETAGLNEDEIAFVMSMSEYPSGVLTMLSATLCRLALPYAGHEDYREEWRP